MNKITGSPLSQVFGGFNAPASNTFFWGVIIFLYYYGLDINLR